MREFPKSDPELYDYATLDAEWFQRAGELMTRIAERKDTSNMQSALLRLYMEEGYGNGNNND